MENQRICLGRETVLSEPIEWYQRILAVTRPCPKTYKLWALWNVLRLYPFLEGVLVTNQLKQATAGIFEHAPDALEGDVSVKRIGHFLCLTGGGVGHHK